MAEAASLGEARGRKIVLLRSLGFEPCLDRGCVHRSAGWRWDGALKPRIHITWAVGSR